MGTVYCGACGAAINGSARFCRSCGRPQNAVSSGAIAAPAATPAGPPISTSLPTGFIAGLLALVGGTATCMLVVYGAIYEPLHYDVAVFDFSDPRFGDLLALAVGATALAIGVLALSGRPGNAATRGVVLGAAGSVLLLLALAWSFYASLDIDPWNTPLHGYVFTNDFGVVYNGDRFFSLPLLAAAAAILTAGLLMAAPSASRPGSVSAAR